MQLLRDNTLFRINDSADGIRAISNDIDGPGISNLVGTDRSTKNRVGGSGTKGGDTVVDRG